jgi:methylmalonyl-CoA/ethylmalonyl-CoA epimerase
MAFKLDYLQSGAGNLTPKEKTRVGGLIKMDKIIDHIEEVVLVVKNQDEAVSLYEDLFNLKFDRSWDMPMYEMKVKSARIGQTQFHIVGSTNASPDAFINKFIKERGEGIHHIAFSVNNLDKTVSRLKEKGAQIIPGGKVSVPGEEVNFHFVHPRSTHGLLIELIGR